MASKSQSFAFGDIFEYNSEEYIFLAETEDVTFAARILNKELSRDFIDRRETVERKNSYRIDNLVYSFVVLKTPQLQGRVAHLYGSDRNVAKGVFYTSLNISLLKEDLKQLQEEITQKKCVSERLKKEVKDLKI